MLTKCTRVTSILLLHASLVLIGGCQSTDIYTSMESMGLPIPEQNDGPSTGKKILAGVGGCAAGGALGYFGVKYFEDKLKEEGYTKDDVNKAAKLIGGLGCVIGGSTAINIVKNMDEQAKRAQEEAWQRAQQQAQRQATTQPQTWETASHRGTVQIVQPTIDENGRECAARRNFITTDEGEAEQYIPVCKNSSGFYEQVEV